MSQLRKMIGEELADVINTARTGGPVTKIGLMASGSELGSEELLGGALEAAGRYRDIQVVMIGPKQGQSGGLEWIETAGDENAVAKGMEKAMKDGSIDGAVALHYPFPLGVTTVGRVMTPARGKPMFIASTTGTSATSRIEAMVLNAIYGIAVAKSAGIENPTVGILNVDGAQTVYRSLRELAEKGYDIRFGESVRKDGGAVLRGNDILAGAVDVCVTDTLTGNVLMKLFSAYSTGGSYESLGWGYGPAVGKNWKNVVSIISRASGAPVIANAIRLTADAVQGKAALRVIDELNQADTAGLKEILSATAPAPKASEEKDIKAPPAEPTDEELHGVDVLSIEDAVRELWESGIYAESAMGCTGPVVKVASARVAEATEILREKKYL
ncbi:MAG: glycine/sarcosine/betaine reductase complex component C subunit alpha [Thermovirgaceae bacterium]